LNRISIIVPTLNEEKLLPAMLSQFTPELVAEHNLEIVVSDGGSSDRTLEIARERASILVENPEHVKQTISMGRNIGAGRSTGDILVFLNADTLLQDPDLFFRTVRPVIAEPGVVAMTAGVRVYPGEERLADRMYHGFYNWFFRMMNVVGMGMGRGECHVMTRAVFERAGGYSEKIAAGEDYDMFRRLTTTGRVRFMNRLVVYESPRRYRRYGYAWVTVTWFMNFLAVFFLRRSILSEWKPVR
jgi:glycosyltransferase involved in cell wall biosynthesis